MAVSRNNGHKPKRRKDPQRMAQKQIEKIADRVISRARMVNEQLNEEYPEVGPDPDGLLERFEGARLTHGGAMGSSQATIGQMNLTNGAKAPVVFVWYRDKEVQAKDFETWDRLMTLYRPKTGDLPPSYVAQKFVCTLAERRGIFWSLAFNNYEDPVSEVIADLGDIAPGIRANMLGQSMWAGAWEFDCPDVSQAFDWGDQMRDIEGCVVQMLDGDPVQATHKKLPWPNVLATVFCPNARFQRKGESMRFSRGVKPSPLRKPKEQVGEIG